MKLLDACDNAVGNDTEEVKILRSGDLVILEHIA